jgi:hypothetical protein
MVRQWCRGSRVCAGVIGCEGAFDGDGLKLAEGLTQLTVVVVDNVVGPLSTFFRRSENLESPATTDRLELLAQPQQTRSRDSALKKDVYQGLKDLQGSVGCLGLYPRAQRGFRLGP